MPAKRDMVVRKDNGALHAILLVAVVAILASAIGVRNEFTQDDIPLIRDNVLVHDIGNLKTFFTSSFWPSPFSPDLFRPFTSLLLAIEYVAGGGTPAVFRIVSYLLYAAASVGVFVLAARLVPRHIAMAVALLFAAHPVHTEAVATAVNQSELAVGLIATVMCIRYLDFRRRNASSTSAWLIIGALYLCASLFKEQGLILPGLLLAVELLFISRAPQQRVRELAGGFIMLAVIGAVVLVARRAVLGGEIAGTFTAEALLGLGIGGRALTMLQIVPQWARLFFWPAHLQADYSPQEFVASHALGGHEALGILLLMLAIVAFVFSYRRAPVVAFGIAWTAVALFPVSNVVIPTGILLAERTLFLPSIGVLIAVAGLVARLWPAIVAKRPAIARDLAHACAAITLVGVVRSAERQLVWRNEAFLSVRSVQDAPRSFRTRRAYGELLFDLDQPKLATEAFQHAIELSPQGLGWRTRNDFARRLRDRGERVQEAEQLIASLAEEPRQEDTRGHLVSAYLNLGKYADASAAVDSAIAHGARPAVFAGMRALADSAQRVGAPAGSIKIGVTMGASRAVR